MIPPLNEYNIDKKYAVDAKGTQEKYFCDGYWYKCNQLGNEALAEQIVSDILSCSNLKITDYVSYQMCRINGKTACRSKNFLNDREILLSFQKLYKNIYRKEMADAVFEYNTPQERFQFVKDFILSATGLDCTEYLQNVFALDMLIGNPDRHFGNLAVIMSKEGAYRFAPIFDNGQGLGQNFQITPPYMEMEEKLSALSAATISGSFEAQYMAVSGSSLKIDYEKVSTILKEYPNGPAKEFMEYQLDKYQKIFDFHKQVTMQLPADYGKDSMER